MSDRQTPEQIADGHSQHFARLSLLTQLAEHGYVIVHPDDIALQAAPDQLYGSTYREAFSFGWWACMEAIFAAVEQEPTP